MSRFFQRVKSSVVLRHVLLIGLLMAWVFHHTRHHHSAASALVIQIPAGWQYGPVPPALQAELQGIQQRTGMGVEATLTTPDGHAAAGVYMRPLSLSQPAALAVVTRAIAGSMSIAGCEPVTLAADESFARCMVADDSGKAATALVVPAGLDRYFLVYAKSQDTAQQPASLVSDFIMQLKVR